MSARYVRQAYGINYRTGERVIVNIIGRNARAIRTALQN